MHICIKIHKHLRYVSETQKERNHYSQFLGVNSEQGLVLKSFCVALKIDDISFLVIPHSYKML